MIAEIRLLTNSIEISERFWRAIYPTADAERGADRWGRQSVRITPQTGPDLLIGEAAAWNLITTVDMVVQTDAVAAQRLRDAGFEVAHDGTQAVDVNAADATVVLVAQP